MKRRLRFNSIFAAGGALVLGFGTVTYLLRTPLATRYLGATPVTYVRGNQTAPASQVLTQAEEKPVAYVPVHQPRPEPLKAIYISSWVAGTSSMFNRLIALVERTEINAVIIDIKDDTGFISFKVKDQKLAAEGTDSNRIPDIEGLIRRLHEKGIYVMGRVSTFQDPLYTKKHPDLAVIRKSNGAVWRDRKGLSWLDAGGKDTWEYVMRIAKESYSRGFDEINFDYIRFPTDGNMNDIAYRFYDPSTLTKPAQMKLFYAYLHDEMTDAGIPHSADLFGMTTTETGDMGIGQLFAEALPYFDFICPMVYPSHYGPGINGFKNPAAHPYEMIMYAMKGAIAKASSTGQDISKIRPWLQDFDLGATYDAAMVRAQIKAVNDAGLSSWLLWDPANRYTEGALRAE